jgi:ATP/ADP translocase
MPSTGRSAAATSLATASVCAFAMIATQVAGKATRDALFLSNFPVSTLPLVLIASACLSIIAVLFTARAMAKKSPYRVIPPLFIVSGLFMLGEWYLAARNPRLGAIVVYLHVAGIGSILISGFWSIINEHFDPRSARRSIGRIVGSATVGGLFGGLLAERVTAASNLLWVLPIIAALTLVCGVLLRRLPPAAEAPRVVAREPAAPKPESGFRVLMRVSYLRNLALIVLFGNVAATLIDYLFKARAAESFAGGAELVRFFAVFYTVVSVITLIVQAGMTGRLLRELGIANTISIRPAVVGIGGLITLPVMGLIGLGILRCIEAVLQSSLFRSGYELLFTPVVPGDKRSTKAIVDVGADRMGDVVGGAVIRAVILLPVAVAGHALMLIAVAISVLGFFIARSLRRGYIHTLEASLINRAGVLDIAPDATQLSLMESVAGMDLSMTIDGIALGELRNAAAARNAATGAAAPEEETSDGTATQPMTLVNDSDVASLMALRSGDANRVRAELRRVGRLSPMVASQVISLLAWDEVTGFASRALSKAAPSITGQLVDRMLDPEEDFAIRRRIPRVLGTCTTSRSHDGLMAALDDKRFEVRFQSAHALSRIHEKLPSLTVDSARVYAAVMKETHVDKTLWDDRVLIDQPASDAPGLVEEAVRARASRRTEYVFTLFSLVLPREPLSIAFKGLLTDDAVLHGTGLEYLESVLPKEIWNRLQPLLDERKEKPASTSPRSREEVLEALMRSTQSIQINLEELKKRPEES